MRTLLARATSAQTTSIEMVRVTPPPHESPPSRATVTPMRPLLLTASGATLRCARLPSEKHAPLVACTAGDMPLQCPAAVLASTLAHALKRYVQPKLAASRETMRTAPSGARSKSPAGVVKTQPRGAAPAASTGRAASAASAASACARARAPASAPPHAPRRALSRRIAASGGTETLDGEERPLLRRPPSKRLRYRSGSPCCWE